MNLKVVYLRKKYWFNDFLHGSPMWKEFSECVQIIENQYNDIGGG